MSDLSGEIIDGRYQLTRLIASGGMATIYAALDLRLDRHVAVKIMHPHLAQDEAFVARFIREAKAAAALIHPNIVAVQDQGWNQGGAPAVFIVMELVEGNTLRDYLHEQGSLNIDQAISVITPVLSALAAAHKLGIVHRDIKPENILISKDGRVKIADFGLARGALLGTTMTIESSVILGSVSYLSPEQVQRGIADARSDIYAVGIVLFEILTGEKPYKGEDPIQIAFRHVNEKVPAPSTLKPGIPPEIDALVQRATSSNPDQRPKDASELLQELNAISEKFNPSKSQMSLELDLPPLSNKPVKERSKRNMPKSMAALITKTDQIINKEPVADTLKKDEKNISNTAEILKKRKVSKRVKRNRVIALGIAIAIGIIAWFVILGPGARVVVPSVVGMSVKNATSEITPLGLQVSVKDEIFSEDVANGKVISSEPGGGGKIETGGTVYLNVSKGKERYDVPQLRGLTPDAAIKAIADRNLKFGAQSEAFDSEIPIGYVISSNPLKGEQVKRDTVINILVSKGIEKIDAATYVGKSGEQALNELTDSGFKVNVTYSFDESIIKGLVVKQSPDGNQAIPKGSTVELIVSKGSQFVIVPNVINKGIADATRDIVNSDLQVVVKKIGTKKIKTVTNIAPKAGTKVKRGSKITITVG
ncbi:MAG: Stk1 family PASTA domain-containing Ser/Thr kinase [Actinobacteria bacterium]|uniref:Unannotated protein n=1 Tax=freshwater metagenome TaxID=449393 RepID=A0A6J7U960_9ZZZZ|nr:Stk1 family PASTA domain-containing Ser/Thr kinase [Actinomycetota bacterium]MTA46114.1 Stk1 family PASTA domain-containing Ser/Thr kinase [Actinomycetota bacterium]